MKIKSRMAFFFVIIMILMVVAVGCSSKSDPVEAEIVYETIFPGNILKEYVFNEVRAKDTFVGRNVSYLGPLKEIKDDHILVGLFYYSTDDRRRVFCKYDSTLTEAVMNLNIEDVVVVKGEIYDFDAYEIGIKLHSVTVVPEDMLERLERLERADADTVYTVVDTILDIETRNNN